MLLENATALAASFSATGAALSQATADLDGTADQAAQNIGALATALAKVNDGLGRTGPNTAASAALSDG